MPDNPSNLLALQSLSFERDDRLLFAEVSLSLAPGDVVQIAGPNGAGKTTLLRVLTGSLSPLDGQILWRGQPVVGNRTQFSGEMLYLGHQTGIKAALSPEENLRWLCQLNSANQSLDIAEALHKVGLMGYEDVPCYSLSAGQQRRVALARLYLSTAPLWILDEPFTAIDKVGVAQLEELMQQHIDRGGMLLITTHQELSLTNVRTLILAGLH